MGVHSEQASLFEFVPELPPVELFCKLWRPPELRIATPPVVSELDELLADVAEDWSDDTPADNLPGMLFVDVIEGVNCKFPLTEPVPFASFRMCGEPVKSPGATYCAPCHKRAHSTRPTWCEREL
jgi:hypothetical protein